MIRIALIMLVSLAFVQQTKSQYVFAGEIYPQNCNTAVPIGTEINGSATMFINTWCQDNGESKFYYGFYCDDNFLLDLVITLTAVYGDTYYEGSRLYGPYSSNFEACADFSSGTPLLTNLYQDVLSFQGGNPSYAFNFSTVIDEGYYLMELTACIGAEFLLPHTNLRISYTNQKGPTCTQPCPTDTTDCEFPPCDTLTICDLFPLECDSCYLNPLLCDSVPPPCDNVITSVDSLDCPTCIDRFAPTPGERYIVEAWVREEDATPLSTTFEDPKIQLRFYNGFDVQVGGELIFQASGPIIEGWQQISEVLEIPINAVRMEMDLAVETGDAYFDDIRVSPFNSALKTYVYDQKTMRLIAELDERNFATLYQYDEEGRLVAVKKETERGIKTIQSIQQNTSTNNGN